MDKAGILSAAANRQLFNQVVPNVHQMMMSLHEACETSTCGDNDNKQQGSNPSPPGLSCHTASSKTLNMAASDKLGICSWSQRLTNDFTVTSFQ